MTDEEKKLIQERFAQMFPKETAQAKMPFYYHEKRKALIVKPHALYEGIRYAEENGISCMEISGDNIDLSPLRDAKSICALGLSGSLENVDSIYQLSLTHLHIDNTNNKTQVDLSEFTMLERLSLIKNKKNIIGLSGCTSLKELWLYNYMAKEHNLSELKDLRRLRRVDLTYARINSLDGIEDLKSLNRISINYSRTLKSIQALSGKGVSRGIKYLEIDHCPNVVTYEPIGSLSCLEKLFIRECKTIDSKKFIESLGESVHVFICPRTKILNES